MNAHLPDETLNEYLDESLDPAARPAVEAHLADCRDCAGRLAALRMVFAGLETMPDAPLERDLSRAVVSALRQRAVPARPVRPVRRALGLVFAAQAAAAALLLAFAWPALAAIVPQAPLPALAQGMTTIFSELTALFARTSVPIVDPLTLWRALEHWAAAGLTAPLPIALQPAEVVLALAAAAGIWLLGNALLFSRPSRLRRRL